MDSGRSRHLHHDVQPGQLQIAVARNFSPASHITQQRGIGSKRLLLRRPFELRQTVPPIMHAGRLPWDEVNSATICCFLNKSARVETPDWLGMLTTAAGLADK
ncbi:hypothetical protein ACFCP7_06600 [Paenibacillus elgii]